MDASLVSLSGVFAERYTIDSALGRGATSTVYKARDNRTGTPVAIKILRRELAETLGPERFLHEIKLMESLHHPRVLPILGSGKADDRLYFVAPYMDGGTLRNRLERDGQLPLQEALRITCTIAEALAYAHSQGLVHRDVKPENILFSEGEACLADFGIARAIERSLEESSTSTGIARGTAAYMSPEQGTAAHNLDGRSDIYSLGCVLYEMITGMRPFLAPTAQAVIAQRFVHPPRPLSFYRSGIPSKLQSVIDRALQVSTADRYQTALEFASALQSIPPQEFEKARRQASKEHVRRRQKIGVVAALGIVAIGSAGAFTSRFVLSRNGELSVGDTTRVVVFPLEGSARRLGDWHDDELIHQALSRWRGLHVVDEFQVADGLRQYGPVESTNKAEQIARSLGAGRYVRGKLIPSGNTWSAYAAIYETGSKRALYSASTELPNDFSGVANAYERLADSLLLRGASADFGPGSSGQASLPAVQAFGRAQLALDRWDLSAADSALQTAAGFDPDYARASLWLAQVRAWRQAPRQAWKSLAERAEALSSQLNDHERELAGALALLGSSEYAKACDVYARLRARNDRDFAAWFGSGQCRMMDDIVIPDPAHPSAWRFRASVARAMEAYEKAFEILPSVHRGYERGAFEKVRNLLLVSQDIRTGYRLPDSAVFYGRLGLVGDSLVMFAYPWQAVFSGDKSSIPPGFHEALARRRAQFRRVTAGWSAAFPRNPGAKHAVAVALELLGDATSIDTIRLARNLEPDSSRKTSLAATEVILLLKFGTPDNPGRLKSAELLADSLLTRSASGKISSAEALAPVAAVTGRCAMLDDLVRAAVPAGGYAGMPTSLLGDANVLTARLAVGCTVTPQAMRSVASDLEQTVGKSGAEQHQRIEQMLLYRSVVLAPLLDRQVTDHLSTGTTDGLLLAARGAARGDFPRARTALTGVEQRVDPGVPTPDITLARARLWLAIGDSVAAVRTLDSALNSLLLLGADDLSDPVNAGALVSMMFLRADLANARHDTTAALRWRSAAQMLFQRADGVTKKY